MSKDNQKRILFINNHAFSSLRSADYSTYYALAELVDNSIQANAKNIHLVGIQYRVNGTNRRNLKEVLVFDDGDGMDRQLAKICLQLGGGNRYNANAPEKNLGKYGIGLTQGSMSQTPRVDIYTWRNSGKVLYNYLDFIELGEKDPPYLPAVKELKGYPKNIKLILDTIKSRTKIKINLKPESGTIIHWCNCDRLDHKTYRAFFDKIEYFIGRIYRKYIIKDNVKISVAGLDKKQHGYTIIEGQNHQSILPNDPMFLIDNSLVKRIDKRFENKATNDKWATINDPVIDFRDENGDMDKKRYDVEINFSHVKKSVREKLSNGWTAAAGNTDLGQLYKKNMGISLMRAGRELKCSDFGFIGDRSDPTNRWWSVEVDFHPDCDNAFGVTFDKQEAKKFKKFDNEEIKEAEESNDPDALLLKAISKYISDNITEMKKVIERQAKGTGKRKFKICPKCGEKKLLNNKCKKCGYVKRFCDDHPKQELDENGICPICEVERMKYHYCLKHPDEKLDENGECPICKKKRKDLNEKQVKELEKYLKKFFHHYSNNEKLLSSAIEYYKSCGRTHVMVYTEQDDQTFISSKKFGDITVIEVNMNHDFYKKFMWEIIDEGRFSDNRIIPIHLLIATFIISKEHFSGDEEIIIDDFRAHFNMDLKRLMRNYDYIKLG